MFFSSLVTAMAVVLAAPNAPRVEAVPKNQSSEAVIEKCEVAAIQNQAVPGSDPGVLFSLNVKEGQQVSKGMEIGRVDDRESQAARTVKQLDFEVAQQKGESNIEVRHAEANAQVAEAAYKKLMAANENLKSTVTQIEIMRANYEWQKAKLGIEKSKEEHISNQLTAKAKKAEVDAAEVAVERRILRAPFDGVVVSVFKHEGEWVAPGDKVVQLVRTDRLRVYGNLVSSDWLPSDIENRKVTVEVQLPRNKTIKVPGRIVFVSPTVGVGNRLPVWAEIDTPVENGRPLACDGLYANMTIHVDQPAEAETRPIPSIRKTAVKPEAETPPAPSAIRKTAAKPGNN